MNTNLAEVLVDAVEIEVAEIKPLELHELAYVGGGAGVDTVG